jgi:uncharacterized protein YaaW (UPF0174 family)
MQKDKSPLINQGRSIDELLKIASHEELSAIANIITDNGQGRIALDSAVKNAILKHQEKRQLFEIAHLLAKEIRAFGSNSIASIVRRGEPIPYLEVALDVAKKLGVKNVSKASSEAEIEKAILLGLLSKSFKDKSPDEILKMLKDFGYTIDSKTQSLIKGATDKDTLVKVLMTSFGTLAIARTVSSALTPTIAVGGAFILGSSVIARAPALLNPLGIAISAIWAGYDASGPAYRVTIPAIAHIAFIRQTQINFEIERAQMELKQCL